MICVMLTDLFALKARKKHLISLSFLGSLYVKKQH